jgi:FMN phosphatase YigB (HAD superfamily)
MPTPSPRVTFFLDVDNTLLDNDGAKRELDRRLDELVSPAEAENFWRVYEEVRAETGMVDIPKTLVRCADRFPNKELRFALADLFMTFDYRPFLFPETLATIAHLRTLGKVAILSDGDPVFQIAKVTRCGLAEAVGGYVLVYPHKEEHLPEITTAFAADHYVLVDDKPAVLRKVAERLTLPLSTVFVRQGRYAASVPPGAWPGAGLTVDSIGELQALDAASMMTIGKGSPV